MYHLNKVALWSKVCHLYKVALQVEVRYLNRVILRRRVYLRPQDLLQDIVYLYPSIYLMILIYLRLKDNLQGKVCYRNRIIYYSKVHQCSRDTRGHRVCPHIGDTRDYQVYQPSTVNLCSEVYLKCRATLRPLVCLKWIEHLYMKVHRLHLSMYLDFGDILQNRVYLTFIASHNIKVYPAAKIILLKVAVL